MKANYPAEFMTAVLSAEAGDTEMIAEIIHESKRMGLAVLPPDINESFSDFTVVKGKPADPERLATEPSEVRRSEEAAGFSADRIRFGLVTIKNLGAEIAGAVVSERKARGSYKNLADFLERVSHKNLNRKSLEALIKAGAMDSLHESRAQMLGNIEALLDYHRERSKKDTAQDSLFGALPESATAPTLKLKAAEEISEKDKLAWEKELLGLYVSGHPLDKFRTKFEGAGQKIKSARELKDGAPIVVGGIIEEVKLITTKRGDRMAFMRLADFTDTIETVVFSDMYLKYRDLLEVDKCVAIKGKVSYRGDDPSIIVEALKPLEE